MEEEDSLTSRDPWLGGLLLDRGLLALGVDLAPGITALGRCHSFQEASGDVDRIDSYLHGGFHGAC